MVQEIPIYDITLDGDSLGLTAISLVDSPAIMENWVAFSKQQMIWMSKAEKREVIAPILIPDQLILRRAEDGSLYYIRWKRETILQAAEKYIANGWFNNFTYMHPTFYNKDMKYEDALEKDIYMLRLWTIEDAANDDANTKYGFHLPEGTLMCHFKVHNRKLWQKIKNKEVMGCSIEAFTTMVKNNSNINVNVNMDINNKQMSLFQKFVAFMNDVASDAAEIADVAKHDTTDSGEVSLKYYIDNEHYIEVDAEGFARDEEYHLIAEGKYLLADGNYLVVDGNNKFVETQAGTVENENEENTPTEAPIAEMKIKDDEKEKKDEETEGNMDKPNSEGEPSDGKPSVEDNDEGDEKPIEDSDEEDRKKKRVSHAELDDEEKKDKEVPTEEVPSEEPAEEAPLTLVPFLIDGVEYQLPQEVVNYINSLIGDKDNVMNEIALMKERIPSAQPIPSVIKQSSEDDNLGLFDAIRMLNYKK